ncbi:hypothetical protein D9M72_541220 [compost metagenome]
MLDHQHRAPGRDFLDQGGHPAHVFMPHALRGFVQQHHLRFDRQGGGQLERALASVGQLAGPHVGLVGQADFVECAHGLAVQAVQRFLVAPETIGEPQRALQTHAHVLKHAEVGKD